MKREYETLCETYESIMSSCGVYRPEDIHEISAQWFASITDFKNFDIETKQLVGKLYEIIKSERMPTKDYTPMYELIQKYRNAVVSEDIVELSPAGLLFIINQVMDNFDDSSERLNYIIRNLGFSNTIEEIYAMIPIKRKNFCNVNGCVYNYLMEIQ